MAAIDLARFRRRIVVAGPLRRAASKALFLRGYSRDVTLLATGHHRLPRHLA